VIRKTHADLKLPVAVTHLDAAGALLVLDAEQAGGCSGLPTKRYAAQL
jgi:hypothetical protein